MNEKSCAYSSVDIFRWIHMGDIVGQSTNSDFDVYNSELTILVFEYLLCSQCCCFVVILDAHCQCLDTAMV